MIRVFTMASRCTPTLNASYNDDNESLNHHTLQPAPVYNAGLTPRFTPTNGSPAFLNTPFTAHPVQYIGGHSLNHEQTYLKQIAADDGNPNLSQITSAQPCCILDKKLENLPRAQYIDTLLKLTKSSETEIASYRNYLFEQIRQFEDCPKGRLISRRGSRRNPTHSMLASDCYVQNMLMKDEQCDIETIFSKSRPLTFEDTCSKDIQKHATLMETNRCMHSTSIMLT